MPMAGAGRAPLLLIAAGGTGGHLFPAQALAEEMLRRGWRVKLATDSRGARYTGGFPHVTEVERVPAATFARRGIPAKLTAPFPIARGVMSSFASMLRDRPTSVVGFGGYPAIPALSAALILRLPCMIHEQNGVLGRVNRFFARRLGKVACGVWPMVLPGGVEGIHIGNPVRKAVRDRAGVPYVPPGQGRMSVLVIGGSQGARILSDVVPAAIASLPEGILRNLRVWQQARDEDLDHVRSFYTDHSIAAEVQSFFRDVPRRMSEAQLVIGRAGASSVAEIGAIGRPSILIPYAAAADDHQTVNARGLARCGAAIVIPESALVPDTLASHIRMVLERPDAASDMAAAALRYGEPEAVATLAGLVGELAQTGHPA